MRKVCIVSATSQGARWLTLALRDMGVDAIKRGSCMEGYLNIGWGRPGDVNPDIPPDKLWELMTCHQAGVLTVPFGHNPTFAMRPEFFMGRNRKHTEGKDITIYRRVGAAGPEVVYRGPKAQVHPDFWVAVVPKVAEYRVHVWMGKAIRSGSKVHNENDDKHHDLIWNLRKGWRISYGHPAPDAAKILAKAAAKALGLDFAAVDVLQGEDGKQYFLEANTKPGIEGNTVIKYATHIKALAEAV